MEIKERQIEIIEAAGEILTESGFNALTTKNLAAKMGFSESALYRHYASKEEIVLTMLKYLAKNMDDRLTDSVFGIEDPEEKVKAILNSQFYYFKKNPHFLIAIFSDGLLEASKSINGAIDQIMATKKKHLLQCIQQGQKEKKFTSTIPADELVHIIMGSFRLHMLQWRLSGFAFDVKARGNKVISNLLTLITTKKIVAMKNKALSISAIVLTLFALLTLFMSGSVIFDLFGIREKEGNYVLFIVVANFVAGFLYLFSAYGMFTTKPWAFRLLLMITGMLLIAFLGLLIHVNQGGKYETQTIKAMIFRISISAVFAGVAWKYISKNNVTTSK